MDTKTDPYALLTKAERRTYDTKRWGLLRLAEAERRHQNERLSLRQELVNLEIEVRSGRPRDKIADHIRQLRDRLEIDNARR